MPEGWKDYIFAFFNALMLTCFGVLMTVIPMNLIDVLRSAGILITSVLCFWNGDFKEKVEDFFDQMISKLFDITVYQIKSLSFTDSLVKLTYENAIWLSLQFAIANKSLHVPELQTDKKTKEALLLSFWLTIYQFVAKLLGTAMSARALKENSLAHTMNKITAMSNWVPHTRFLVTRKLYRCLDFSKVSMTLPGGMTKTTGVFLGVDFEFDDRRMKSFVYELESWKAESTKKELEELSLCKLRFLVSSKTIEHVTDFAMTSALVRFPWDYFTLVMKTPKPDEFDKMKNYLCRIE
jgi:hypothetical protein